MIFLFLYRISEEKCKWIELLRDSERLHQAFVYSGPKKIDKKIIEI